MSSTLNSKSKVALLWSFSGSLVKQFAFLFITIILARLLEPREFGIVAMSVVFIGISEMLLDSGFTSGLIQQKDTKDITFSSVFYLNLGISLLLSTIIILTAPFIAVFLEEPRIENILYYLSIIPPISALGLVQAAILKKNIDFKSLTLRDILSTIIGGILGVIAAFLDYGVYSLVIQQISTVIISTIMLWFATQWTPKFEFSFYEIKKLFQFSGYVFLDTLSQRLLKHIDTIFIAKVFSPAILGFYSKAESLKAQVVSYATNSLSKVMYPVFSKLQDDEKGFKAIYHRAFNIVTGLVIILVAPLYFLAHFIIILLLGDKWEPSVILFQTLIFLAITGPHISMMARAILSKGFSKYMFKIGLVSRLIKLSPIAVGLYYGIEEFAIAIVVASFVIFFMLSYIIDKKLDVNFLNQIRNFLIPNIIFFLFLVVSYFLEDYNNWLMVALFLVIQLMFMKAIKHESYVFLIYNIKRLVKR